MKYLLIVVLVLGAWWLLRPRRPRVHTPEASRAHPVATDQTKPPPTEIVACRHCQVHLPRQDALPGSGGHYCSEAHRREAGDD